MITITTFKSVDAEALETLVSFHRHRLTSVFPLSENTHTKYNILIHAGRTDSTNLLSGQ